MILQMFNLSLIYLECSNSSTLESQVSLEVLGNFSDQTLEGQLADEQLRGLLVATDLPQSHSSGPKNKTNKKRLSSWYLDMGNIAYNGSRLKTRFMINIPHTCNDGASSLLQWKGRSSWLPWWRAASLAPFLR